MRKLKELVNHKNTESLFRWKGLMISVLELENGVKNAENCKLLDTHCLNVPVYRYLVSILHLGLSSMPPLDSNCITGPQILR